MKKITLEKTAIAERLQRSLNAIGYGTMTGYVLLPISGL